MKQYVATFSTSCKFFFITVSFCVLHVIISICSLAETFRPFSQIMYYDFTRFSVLEIVYENYYYEQLATIRTLIRTWIQFAEMHFVVAFWET